MRSENDAEKEPNTEAEDENAGAININQINKIYLTVSLMLMKPPSRRLSSALGVTFDPCHVADGP